MSGKRIVVADDEGSFTEVLCSLLREEGYETAGFAYKPDAYDWIASNKTDLVISDVRSPGMDGFEFLQWLRENPFTQHIPFVFITGYSDITAARRAFAMGASEFRGKPFDYEDLLGLVRALLSSAPAPREIHVGPSPSPVTWAQSLTFLPWRTLEELVTAAAGRLCRNIGPLHEAGTWSTSFACDSEYGRIGVTYVRPLGYGRVDPAHVLGFAKAMYAGRLQRGLMFVPFNPPPMVAKLACLFGIEIVAPESTGTFVCIGYGEHRTIRTMDELAGFRIGLTEGTPEFLKFVGSIQEALRKFSGLSFSVEHPGLGYAAADFSLQKSEQGYRLRFTLGRNAGWAYEQLSLDPDALPGILMDMWNVSAEMRGRQAEFRKAELCLLEMFSMISGFHVDERTMSLSHEPDRPELVLDRQKPVVAVLEEGGPSPCDRVFELESAGFKVLGYDLHPRVFEVLPMLMPDVIVSDLRSSHMDGVDFLRTVKADRRFKDIPVILRRKSGGGTCTVEEMRKLGAADCLDGDSSLEEFASKVRAALGTAAS